MRKLLTIAFISWVTLWSVLGEEKKATDQSRDEVFATFTKLLDIGSYGKSDEEILKIEGVSAGDLANGSKMIFTGKEDPLGEVSYSGGSTNGKIDNVRVAMNESNDLADRVKAHVEKKFKIKFPEPEIKTTKMFGDMPDLKISIYRKMIDGVEVSLLITDGATKSLHVSMDVPGT